MGTLATGSGDLSREATTRSALVVIEEALLRELISTGLRRAGVFPLPAASAADGQRLAEQVLPDAIVFDVDRGDGADARWAFDLARSAEKPVRTVMLTARGGAACNGDGCAADLCIVKPVEPRQFVQEVLRLLRPARTAVRSRPLPPIRLPELEVDRDSPTVRVRVEGQWRTLDLPRTEHRLLLALLAERERVASRESLRAVVWEDEPVGLRSVDQYVKRLRASLAEVGAREIVRTVSGSGYRIDLTALPP